MESDYSAQATLEEFFTPKKSMRIWRIVLAVLTSLMMLGVAYELTKPAPDPVRMTHDTGRGTYAYLDLQLLSDWIYDVSGDYDYTFYEAMDADGNWFFIALEGKQAAALSAYTDAYDAFFTDDYASYDYPEPTRLTGVVRRIDSDDKSTLEEAYELADGNFTSLFGSYYLDEGASDAASNATMYGIGALIFGLAFLFLVLAISAGQKNYRKSENGLYELGLMDEAERQFTDPDALRYPKIRLVLSEDFAYLGDAGYILRYEEIDWLYRRQQRSNGVTIATQFVAELINGKTAFLPIKKADDAFASELTRRVLAKNPNCLIGYALQQARLHGQRVKEYRAAHRQ